MSPADAARRALEARQDWPDDSVVLARSVVRALGEDHVRLELHHRLERVLRALQIEAKLSSVAEDLRRAAALAEADPIDEFRKWLARTEDDLRRRLAREVAA